MFINKLFFFIVVLLFILFIPLSQSQDINQGLVGYYPFKGNADDHSGNNRHGTIYGNPQYEYDRWDYPNSSLVLDGINDYVVFPIGEYPNLAISVWLKPFIKNDSAFIFDYGNGTFSSQIDAKTTATSPSYNVFHFLPENLTFQNASMMYFTEWHHLYLDSGTDKQGPRVFIDGYLDKEIQKKVILKAINNLLYLGRKSGNASANTYYFGEIDDLRIYNRPLSNTEISLLYAVDPISIKKQVDNKIHIFNDYVNNQIVIHNQGLDFQHIEILGTTACIIYQETYKDIVDISLLPKGIYFLRLMDNKGNLVYVRKFIKL